MVPAVTLDVAVLGTGRMGGAMAGTLRGEGFPVRVWNRTSSRAREVAEPIGAVVAGTPRDAVAGADIVISSLADDEAVMAAFTGPAGAVEGLHDDHVALRGADDGLAVSPDRRPVTVARCLGDADMHAAQTQAKRHGGADTHGSHMPFQGVAVQ